MTVHNDELFATEPAADADLILRTRSGDGDAFSELWRRHYPSGLAVARSVTSSIDPDDLVQESYARIYQAVLKGGGPNGSFRAYLFTSIRNTAAAWGRARRDTAMDELETVADPDSTEQASDDALDRRLTAQAFRSLPTRWQEVLWYSEIEQMKPAAIAPLLGMKAGAVSQLAFRAREGLREAWVQAHLRNTASDSECHWTIEHLGAYALENVSSRDRARIDAHLGDCARCRLVAGEADEVSGRLALVLLPMVLGVAGASGYASMLQSGAVPVAAVAAMPSSVVTGSVVITGATPVGLDAAASAGGSSAGTGASGGAITGIGALVGAGAAALVVAGVVAAATIVPGLLAANPVTSLPNAGGADSSVISSDVAPDSSIESKDTLVLDVPEPRKPKDAPDQRSQEPVAPPAADTMPAEENRPPADDGGQHGNGAGDSSVDPDPTDPGLTDPGPTDPEPTDPEPTDPDPTDPEPTDPDPTDLEPTDPETTDPELPVGPVLPEGTPSWSAATQNCAGDVWLPVTEYTVPLSGEPDADILIQVDGAFNDDDYAATLGADGTGSVVLKPRWDQVLGARNTSVSFRYVVGDLIGDAATVTLFDLYSGPSCVGVQAPPEGEIPAE